jgi:hypothetical protein
MKKRPPRWTKIQQEPTQLQQKGKETSPPDEKKKKVQKTQQSTIEDEKTLGMRKEKKTLPGTIQSHERKLKNKQKAEQTENTTRKPR